MEQRPNSSKFRTKF